MRLTSNEQAILKCICNAQCPATRHYIVVQTTLDFLLADECLGKLIASGHLELQPNGSFTLTTLAKCNPVVSLMLQEKTEERLWVDGMRRRQPYNIISRFRSIVYYYLQTPN